jgi:hypothetical protein
VEVVEVREILHLHHIGAGIELGDVVALRVHERDRERRPDRPDERRLLGRSSRATGCEEERRGGEHDDGDDDASHCTLLRMHAWIGLVRTLGA